MLSLCTAVLACALVLLWPGGRSARRRTGRNGWTGRKRWSGRSGRESGDALTGRGRAAAARTDASPGLDAAVVADLVSAALGAGVSPARAVQAVADSVARTCPPGGGTEPLVGDLVRLAAGVRGGDLQLAVVRPALEPLREALQFAVRTGTPAVEPLTQAAREVRRAREAAAERAANQLAARLVLPLGLAALPGFLLLGIAPVVVQLLSRPPV